MLSKRGFKFDETMSGTFAMVNSPREQRPLSFTVQVCARSLLGYLRNRQAVMAGTLDAPGLADHVPIEGTMLLDPLGSRVIGYEFHFTGNDGKPYRFAGQKNIELTEPIRSFTQLPAQILDNTGNLVATCDTHFDLRGDWLSFLLSWRLH